MNSIILLLCFFCLLVAASDLHRSKKVTVDLLHRDSPDSPFYNASDDKFVRIKRAMDRSSARLKYINGVVTLINSSHHQFQAAPVTTLSMGEYLMNISVGTPPVQIAAIMDTGSDLTWIRCAVRCNTVMCDTAKDHYFNRSLSSSYVQCSCRTEPKVCSDLATLECQPGSEKPCLYYRGYADGSSTNGLLSRETMALETVYSTRFAIQNVLFGCAFGGFEGFENYTMGMVGMDRSPYSLVQQMPGYKAFTYCLVPWPSSSPSHVYFGEDESVYGDLPSTPIINKGDQFYYLGLEAIIIDNEVVQAGGDWWNGNIVIDSGSTMTYLPNEFLERVENTMKNKIKGWWFHCADPVEQLKLCYRWNGLKETPSFVVRFKGGMKVSLNNINLFVETAPGCFCFAFAGQGKNGISIYGTVAQFNFRVTYDIENGKNKLAMVPLNCADGHQ